MSAVVIVFLDSPTLGSVTVKLSVTENDSASDVASVLDNDHVGFSVAILNFFIYYGTLPLFHTLDNYTVFTIFTTVL